MQTTRRILKRILSPSKSTPGKNYETLVWSDGTLSCNCRGWTYKKEGKVRTCKHVEDVIKRDLGFSLSPEALEALRKVEQEEKKLAKAWRPKPAPTKPLNKDPELLKLLRRMKPPPPPTDVYEPPPPPKRTSGYFKVTFDKTPEELLGDDYFQDPPRPTEVPPTDTFVAPRRKIRVR